MTANLMASDMLVSTQLPRAINGSKPDGRFELGFISTFRHIRSSAAMMSQTREADRGKVVEGDIDTWIEDKKPPWVIAIGEVQKREHGVRNFTTA